MDSDLCSPSWTVLFTRWIQIYVRKAVVLALFLCMDFSKFQNMICVVLDHEKTSVFLAWIPFALRSVMYLMQLYIARGRKYKN